MKRKKHVSDVAATFAPPSKSRLLEKSSLSPKNASLSSYDFAGHVTHDPLVSRMSELEVNFSSVLSVCCRHTYLFLMH